MPLLAVSSLGSSQTDHEIITRLFEELLHTDTRDSI